MTIDFSDQEREIISLRHISKALDSMLNYLLLDVSIEDGEGAVKFKDYSHAYLFNALLADFLVEKKNILFSQFQEKMEVILSICNTPHFNKYDTIFELEDPTAVFKNWLDYCGTYPSVYLANINTTVDLKFTRKKLINICGNIAKHSISNLSTVADKITKILKLHNIQINEEDSYILIEDFFEWFHQDIFHYHATNIVGMLNGIRWGIHKYLLPEYNASIRHYYNEELNLPAYEYTYPKCICTKYGKHCYWDLMNIVRSKPTLPEFSVNEILKSHY